MPFAIFYDGHYAIHGTDQISHLGAPASNGCVRLHPDNAAILFDMVKAEGKDNVRVEIVQ
jgi:lipoprotein-anchoring transpeptidase ErfK/SrfK